MNKLITIILCLLSIHCQADIISTIIPYPPGNGGDTIFRIFQSYCQSHNVQIIPTYKIGHDGMVGLLSFSNSNNEKSLAISGTVSISNTLKQHSDVDFNYISLLSIPTFVLVSSKQSSIQSLDDLQNKTKSLNIGSAGASHLNLVNQLLKHLNKNIDIIVPYKNTNQLIIDLSESRIDIAFLRSNVAIEYEQAGKLTIIASTSKIFRPNTIILSDKYPNWVNVNAYGLIMTKTASVESIKFWSKLTEDFLNDKDVQQLIENESSVLPNHGQNEFKKLVYYDKN